MDDGSAPFFASADRPSVRNTDLQNRLSLVVLPAGPTLHFMTAPRLLLIALSPGGQACSSCLLDCWFQFCSLKYHRSRTIQTIWRAAMCLPTVRNGQF